MNGLGNEDSWKKIYRLFQNIILVGVHGIFYLIGSWLSYFVGFLALDQFRLTGSMFVGHLIFCLLLIVTPVITLVCAIYAIIFFHNKNYRLSVLSQLIPYALFLLNLPFLYAFSG